MHSAGLDIALSRIRQYVFIHPKEFSNTAADTDELLCSAASIRAHVANIYPYANFRCSYPAIP